MKMQRYLPTRQDLKENLIFEYAVIGFKINDNNQYVNQFQMPLSTLFSMHLHTKHATDDGAFIVK